MITLASNPATEIITLISILDGLQPQANIINTIKQSAYTTLLPIMKNRIHSQGTAADGSAIGSNLVRTGTLRDGFVETNDGLGFTDDTLGERATMLEGKYSKAIWQPTVDEEQQVIQLAQNILNNAFSGK